MFHWVPLEDFTLSMLQMVKNQTLVSCTFHLVMALLIKASSFMARSCRNQAAF